MTPVEIERRLDRQFKAATGGRRGAMERHQTLRAAIDWSYELLTPGARALLARLSVCVGGFDLEAADALGAGIEVAGADAFDLLRELVGKSLVERYEANANTRYRLLEMIRQYAAERLDQSGDTDKARDLHAAHHARRLVQLAGDVASDDEYEVLDVLGIETPNIAAGLKWWLSTDRIADVLGCFGDTPYFDGFATPTVTLDELTPIARAAVDAAGSEQLRGFAEACMFACFLAFLVGDIDDYRRLTIRAGAVGDSVAEGVTASCLAMFEGDIKLASQHAARASELARDADSQLVVWTLAHQAVMESTVEHASTGDVPPIAASHADEALRIARAAPGTVVLQYPLLAVATCSLLAADPLGSDAARGLAAADEVMAIDRTQRQFWSTTVGSAAANSLASRGDAVDQLVQWGSILRDHHEHEELFMFVILLASISEAMVDPEPTLAVDLAAIAECGVIAPTATFTVFPKLIQRAAEDPEMIAAARARAMRMTRDEACDFVFDGIEAVLKARGLATAAED